MDARDLIRQWRATAAERRSLGDPDGAVTFEKCAAELEGLGDDLWTRRARVVSVHDGDTVTMDVDLGFTARVQVDLRLRDAWAPELREPGGVDVRDYLRRMVASRPGDWPWHIRTERVRGDGHEVTTFARYVATVWPAAAGDEPTMTDAVNAYVTAQGYDRGTGAPSSPPSSPPSSAPIA